MAVLSDKTLLNSIKPRSEFHHIFSTDNYSLDRTPPIFRWTFKNVVTGQYCQINTLSEYAEPRIHLSPDRGEWVKWVLEDVYKEVRGLPPEPLFISLPAPMDSELSAFEIEEFSKLRSLHPFHSPFRSTSPPPSTPREIRLYLKSMKTKEGNMNNSIYSQAPELLRFPSSRAGSEVMSTSTVPTLPPDISDCGPLYIDLSTQIPKGPPQGSVTNGAIHPLPSSNSSILEASRALGEAVREIESPKKLRKMDLMGLIDTDDGISKILGVRDFTPAGHLTDRDRLTVVDEFRRFIHIWPQSVSLRAMTILENAVEMSKMIRLAVEVPRAVPDKPFMCVKEIGEISTLCFFKNREDFLQRQDSSLPPSLIFYVLTIGGERFNPIDPTETILSSF